MKTIILSGNLYHVAPTMSGHLGISHNMNRVLTAQSSSVANKKCYI